MKKLFIIILLSFSIPSFADKTDAKDEWTQKTIIGLWSMMEAYDEANVLDLKDNGKATLYLFKCDNKNKTYTSAGDEKYTYEIKKGELLLKELGKRDVSYRLNIKRPSIVTMELQYNMPNSELDKITLFYIKNREIKPLCTYIAKNMVERNRTKN
ncbi:hypothetical protein [Gilliamella sp. wkB112]|uniref:hypothetical protein n=1 Tax=Gilliamella sp. wkB112 TaxID=3120257 RepID=UPI00080DEB33|nr:hypothetical protein [Gilliamella apicola]OCG03024.1 hypothetical protein A9G12_08880 [Gilliamella apicola]